MSEMPLVFVDTNVLIHAEDARDPVKQDCASRWLDALWRERAGRVSVQVLNEFYLNVTRKITPPMPQGDARAKVRRYNGWNPWVVDHATVETAWAIEARHGLSWWDCLVVAAAQHSGCKLVLSDDMQHEGQYGAVQVINPFKTSPESLVQP